jgi:L-fuculose-phosphate aldolase
VRDQIILYGKLLYDKGLIAGTAGNISVRSGPDEMLITPSGACKGMLDEKDLVRVRISDGKALEGGRPSIETPFHLAFYRKRPEVGAVVHTHPEYCTTLAVMGREVIPSIIPEGLLVLGREVPMVPYGTPGSEQLAANLDKAAAEGDAFLMEMHGALTVGKDLKQAAHRMETLEFVAKVQCLAELSGGLRLLPKDEAERILAMR